MQDPGRDPHIPQLSPTPVPDSLVMEMVLEMAGMELGASCEEPISKGKGKPK